MNLVDKLILAALVLMLPIGVFLAQWLVGNEAEGQEAQVTEVDVAALEQVIRQTVSQTQTPVEKPPAFNIGAVSYASESALLTVAGKAPRPQASIIVTVVALADIPDNSTPPASPTPILGQKAEVFSIQPSADGNFTYSYQLPRNARDSILELRFDQDVSTKTIRYDTVSQKQLF